MMKVKSDFLNKSLYLKIVQKCHFINEKRHE